MKYHFLKLSTLLILTGLLSTVATAATERDQHVGMCLGHVYSTDIVTYVDGMPITSYNIGGKTVIAAADLMEYGFQVNWNEEDRTVFITSGRYPEQIPAYQPVVDTPGRILGNIYQSDIRVFVNNQEIPSYNIGGQTMIAPSDMSTSNTNNFEQCNLNQKLGYSIQKFRGDLQGLQQDSCLRDGCVFLGFQEPLLFQLDGTKLFRQSVPAGDKKVRIDQPLLFQLGQ
ncbi:MAG: hypothetical protein KHX40_13055 [Oscillospiraceae bacterium]|nr:hypothetical protein [Oscillospiraceae bacterium]